jgi:uncharacterized protein
MLKIIETTPAESLALVESTNFGHLGCIAGDQPYVLPMHYAFDGESIYFLTKEGMKTEALKGNPKVCLQIENITNERHWQSVIVFGTAELLTEPAEISRAANFLVKRHASLKPALNATIIKGEERETSAVVSRLRPETISGRKTVKI